MILRKISKKGNILTENIVFIILNLIFLTILMLFLFSKIDSTAVLEEKYAKQIALMIDSSMPDMTISFNMKDAHDKLEEGLDWADAVKINGNKVFVKLSDRGGYEYSFFNNVDVGKPYPDDPEEKGYYVITISEVANEYE